MLSQYVGHPEGSKKPLPKVEDALLTHLKRGRLLDIGCGRGYALRRFGAYGFETVGIEIDAACLREARTYGTALRGTAVDLPFQDGTFDVALVNQVLHHVDAPEMALEAFHRVLQPNGYLLLSEAVEDSPLIRLGRLIRPEWDGVPVRARFQRAELRGWLADCGFTLVSELRWGTISIAASALGQLLPPVRRWAARLWTLDIWISRALPFGHGFYTCLARKADGAVGPDDRA